jgi:pyruvate,water dikinase
MKFIKPFRTITLADVPLVGGKTASLGQMISSLHDRGVTIPDGFAITSQAYWHYVDHNGLMDSIEQHMNQLYDYTDIEQLKKVGTAIRNLFLRAQMPSDLAAEIIDAYNQLGKEYRQNKLSVAVRSSATAEDLPTASFAGQQESFLNIVGDYQLIESCKKCFASLFTDRAIVYRHDNNFDYKTIALSIAVQKMVRSDVASSGVAFSLDTESGFKNTILINGSYGLGEAIVQGLVVPDEFVVFKPTLELGHAAIIKKERGSKETKVVYDALGTKQIAVGRKQQQEFCLTDEEIISLAKTVLIIESFYTQQKGSWSPMDVEWAKDGKDGKIYIVQARPETIHAHDDLLQLKRYELKNAAGLQPLVSGQSVGQQIVSGTARIIESVHDIAHVQGGDIIVTRMTDPDWVPALKKAVGIITQMGGRTCHAAIVARELRIPALVGAEHAMSALKNGTPITIDCSQGKTGFVYEGTLPFSVSTTSLHDVPHAPAEVMINLADPERAFSLSFLPVAGVGLARIEFIITNTIKIHPLALLHPELVDKKSLKKINELTENYEDKRVFFVEKLAQGISLIAAAFYPRPVIVRLSDFKTNEYRNLIGGEAFEPQEENPMIGFRGAIRYYSDRYSQAFALECQALKKVRDEMGLTNVKIMVPFVRTLQEGQRVIQEMASHGLVQAQNGLEIIMMCEIPANVVLIDEFLKDFDGISIGSNDLTQLTLGVDRDSPLLSGVFDERDAAMKKMFEFAIAGALRANKYSGICGQAPSDYPELADYLISLGIKSISLNPDSVVPFLMRYKKQ